MGELCSERSSETTQKMRSEDETVRWGAGGCTPGTAHSEHQTLWGKCEYRAEDKTHHTQTYGLVERLQDLGPLWDLPKP